MRRKDREITDRRTIYDVIRRCYCCRLGLNSPEGAYVLPMSFGFCEEEETFYFHCAKEGRKIDLMNADSRVGFELDTDYKLNEGDVACLYSARFKSVIGYGKVSFVSDDTEKIRGLNIIMKQHTGKSDWSYSPEMLKDVCVFKLKVISLSCKEHL